MLQQQQPDPECGENLVINFRKKQPMQPPPPPLYIKGTAVEMAPHTKFLGSMLPPLLHCKKILKKKGSPALPATAKDSKCQSIDPHHLLQRHHWECVKQQQQQQQHLSVAWKGLRQKGTRESGAFIIGVTPSTNGGPDKKNFFVAFFLSF